MRLFKIFEVVLAWSSAFFFSRHGRILRCNVKLEMVTLKNLDVTINLIEFFVVFYFDLFDLLYFV
jgi:hypothetical protein